jgi:hypothetical protein
MVLDIRWYRTDRVVRAVRSNVPGLMYRPGQLPDRASVIGGELQTGGNSICLLFMFDWSAHI